MSTFVQVEFRFDDNIINRIDIESMLSIIGTSLLARAELRVQTLQQPAEAATRSRRAALQTAVDGWWKTNEIVCMGGGAVTRRPALPNDVVPPTPDFDRR